VPTTVNNVLKLTALNIVVLLILSWYPAVRAQVQRRVPEATIYGVGDIIHCNALEGANRTGRLMERLLDETPASIGITFGDNSNDTGSEADYECLQRSWWGRLNGRVFPTPGNHDYQADGALPFYFLYWANAGAPGQGYYAFEAGGWRIYALNSELQPPARQEQLTWLENELRVHAKTQCIAAYFHRPPFSSGNFASPAWVLPIYRKLYKHGVDLVATGHEHFFASLPPLTPDGVVDTAYGIPILIAGTGGAVMFEQPRRLRYGGAGEVVVAQTLGVLKLTLEPGSYAWRFVPVDADAPSPAGSGRCHDNPPGYIGG
jgi:acid phosphatase type 7